MAAWLAERRKPRLTLVDPASDRVLARGRLTTSASGTFAWRAKVALSGMREVRAAVYRPGRATPLAWVEHSLARACPLASTGPDRTLSLVGVGLSAFTLGLLLLAAFAYQGRHAFVDGRHLAPPYRSRRALPR